MEYVKSFRDLDLPAEILAFTHVQAGVYKRSRQLWREIFEVSKKFPKEEIYSLADQVRRSSRSVKQKLFVTDYCLPITDN